MGSSFFCPVRCHSWELFVPVRCHWELFTPSLTQSFITSKWIEASLRGAWHHYRPAEHWWHMPLRTKHWQTVTLSKTLAKASTRQKTAAATALKPREHIKSHITSQQMSSTSNHWVVLWIHWITLLLISDTHVFWVNVYWWDSSVFRDDVVPSIKSDRCVINYPLFSNSWECFCPAGGTRPTHLKSWILQY